MAHRRITYLHSSLCDPTTVAWSMPVHISNTSVHQLSYWPLCLHVGPHPHSPFMVLSLIVNAILTMMLLILTLSQLSYNFNQLSSDYFPDIDSYLLYSLIFHSSAPWVAKQNHMHLSEGAMVSRPSYFNHLSGRTLHMQMLNWFEKVSAVRDDVAMQASHWLSSCLLVQHDCPCARIQGQAASPSSFSKCPELCCEYKISSWSSLSHWDFVFKCQIQIQIQSISGHKDV